MTALSELLKKSRKIVIKIGSNVLSSDNGTVNREVMRDIADQVNSLMNSGKQVIIVSSGAGICGAGAIDRWSRRDDMNYKQALCAIGQVELMMAYKEYFAVHGINVGQMLLTRDDFTDNQRNLHIRNTLFTMVDEGVVPIINENDSVSVEEIKIGDNDTLAAAAASLWNADILIMLSDIDGVFDKDPKDNKDARLIEEIYDLDSLLENIDARGKSDFGTGGIITKIEAAKRARKYYIPTVLMNGRKRSIIIEAAEGKAKGTAFLCP